MRRAALGQVECPVDGTPILVNCTVITGSRNWTDRVAIEAVLVGADLLSALAQVPSRNDFFIA
jgi:hypothetical protein